MKNLVLSFIFFMFISTYINAGESDSKQWNRINGYCMLSCTALGGGLGAFNIVDKKFISNLKIMACTK